MKKTEKARIEWGGSHSILATGARRNPELRGGSHSILSKRRPLRGGSQFPFYLVKKAALVGRLPFYPGKKTKPGISWKKRFFIPFYLVKKGGPLGAAPILSWLQAESRICGFCIFARIEWRLPLTLRFWTHSILAKGGIQNILGKNPWKAMEKTVKRQWKRIKKTVKNG